MNKSGVMKNIEEAILKLLLKINQQISKDSAQLWLNFRTSLNSKIPFSSSSLPASPLLSPFSA